MAGGDRIATMGTYAARWGMACKFMRVPFLGLIMLKVRVSFGSHNRMPQLTSTTGSLGIKCGDEGCNYTAQLHQSHTRRSVFFVRALHSCVNGGIEEVNHVCENHTNSSFARQLNPLITLLAARSAYRALAGMGKRYTHDV